MAAITSNDVLTGDIGNINLIAAAEAERTLMRRFASVRNLSGLRNPCSGKLRVIETGAYAELATYRRRPDRQSQSYCRPGEEPYGHHEGWSDIQERDWHLRRT